MRYFMAVLVPIGFAVAGFSLLAILTNLAENWTAASQQRLAAVALVWAHYWWIATIVLAAGCWIAAVVSDALRPATPRKR